MPVKLSWKKKWQQATDQLNKRQVQWKRNIKDAPSMYDFLKKNIYEETK